MSHPTSREEAVFNAALELPTPAGRAALLDRECGGDAALRAAVESLLRASDEAGGSFLGAPTVTVQPGATIALPGGGGGTIVLGAARSHSSSPVTLPPEEYEVGHEIARGGMGSILEAEDRKLGRKVAMKVMKLESSASDYARTRFVREATVLARLEHPNIVPIHELGWDADNRLFYTMKLVQGRTLQAILNGLKEGDQNFVRHYTLDRLLTIFRKICDALSLAHAKGVIHRDLKPENVMVGEFGEVLVMDWGIAKILGDTMQAAEESSQKAEATEPGTAEKFRELASEILNTGSGSLTMDGTVMGTPHYMSPEQADGRVTEIDQQSDVFSLGAILYAILTLRPPVEADSPYDVLELIKRGEIQPPTDYNVTTPLPRPAKRGEGRGEGQPGSEQESTSSPHPSPPLRGGEGAGAANPKKFQPLPHCPGGKVPAALSSVAMKALTVDKSERYPTVAALAADIEAYQGGFATSAEHAGLFTQIALLIQRHKREFAIGAAAALVLVVFSVWFVINLRAKERRAVAGEEKAVAEAERATKAEKVAVDKGEAARRALAKAQISLADSAFRNADLAGMVLALDACPTDLRDQSWQYLATKRDASLRTVECSEVPNANDVLAVPGRPGQFVLTKSLPKIVIVDVADDRTVQTFATGIRGDKNLAVSGDGRVLAVAGNKSKSVSLFDIASGASRKQLTSPIEAGALALNHDGTRLAIAATGQGVLDGCALLDANDGRTLWRFRKRVQHIAFTRDGSRLVISSSGARRQVNLLRVEDGGQLSDLAADATSQALSPDGKTIAIGTAEGIGFLLDAATGAVLRQAQLHTGRIYSMAWTADGHLLTAGEGGKFNDGRWVFRLWEPEKLTVAGVFFGLRPGTPTPWSLHPESGDLLTAGNPPRLWRLPVGLERIKLSDRAEQAWSGCFLSDTVMLARKGYGLVRYDLSTAGKAVEVGDSYNYRISASHFASGMFVLAMPPAKLGQEFGRDLSVFRLENGGAVEKRALKFEGRIPRLAFDAAGERLVAVGVNTPLEVFDMKSGQSLLKAPGEFERAVFAGTGHNLVALSRRNRKAQETEDQLIALDGATGAALRTVTNGFRVNALAASPDGKLVAIAGSDQSVHLFDAATLVEKSSFRAHDGEITALAFHPTLPVIATAAMDRSVKLWEHGTARMVEQFLGLGGTPVVLAFNPSGTLLLVDGQERTTRVFDV
ncbi:MAG: protein kinase, partial [Verrucomicrobia bacterium]|nr:protein kinase [Verrucomicrobiota bacterium]